MANQNPIANWLYQNKQKFSVQFTKLNWTKDYGFELSDYEVSCTYKSKKLIGRGIDSVQAIALEKASSELLERMFCVDQKIDSTGLAISAVIDTKEHAKLEAMERFYLKEHLEKKVSFRLLEANSNFIDEVQAKLNCKVRFFQMRTVENIFGIVAQILSENNEFSYGFSLGLKCESAVNKSLQEALPNFIWKIKESPADEDCPWQLTYKFHHEITPLFGANLPVELKEISEINLTEHEISLNGMFCAEIADLKINRFTY